MWIDCHAHLDRLPGPELPALLDEAYRAGVSTVLSAATGISSCRNVASLCSSFGMVYGAAGISPFDVRSLPDDWEEQLEECLDHDRILAVGEIGLDASNPRYPPFADQLPVFERQLRIAARRGLPAIIHSRGAERKAAALCRSTSIVKAVFHCFTGSREDLLFILAAGYHVSFSGIITFSGKAAELLDDAPLDRIFIETDAPYLAPVPYRGRPNRPAWAALVGEAAATRKGVPAEKLQGAIGENFRKVFLDR